MTAIGKRVPLRDGASKAAGRVNYAGDVALPGLLHARLVLSPYPHAAIRAIDTSQARAVPGVVAVLTAEDLPDIVPTSRHRLLLARDRVIFAGQPVALVVAEDEATAQDAADLVFVDYDPLPAVVDPEAAMAPDAPLVWPEGIPGSDDETAAAHGADVGGEDVQPTRSNISNRVHFARGDAAQALAEAEVVVERTYTTSRVHQNYLEPQTVVARPEPEGITIWTSTQAPFFVQSEVADLLGMTESDVRVIPTPVGGGFGGKFLLFEPLVAFAAQKLRRPVRLKLTRMEELLATKPAPAARIHVQLGARRDGTITVLRAHLLFDSGCYPGTPVGVAAFLLGSYYQIPNVEIEGVEVLTFKASNDAYRAPGAPQATFAIESAMDELAQRLGVDAIELRLRHASATGDPTIRGRPWPRIGLRNVLEAIREHPLWQNREQARAEGRGVGVAVGGWPGGIEPAAATCLLQRDGTLTINVGSVDLTGSTTAFALIAAEVFDVPPEKIRIVTGDTLTAPYAGATGGSKITYTVGAAVLQAVEEAKQQVLAIAAEELEADPGDLELRDGAVHVRGVPGRSLSLAEIAGKTMRFGGRYAPVLGHGRTAITEQAPGFCAQLAEVSVDPDTGVVRVHRLVLAQDVGRAINPLLIEGQMMGGAVQGLGWALHEQIAYDENGQVLTASWMDYSVPRAPHVAEAIECILVEVPSEHGPFGARGVGEPPVVATAAAVANAIAHATGVRLSDLPMTPQRVWRALQGGDA
ncbi:xanthine dehydrogenase family protein molybdopterin-binding subunit [Ardenticatena maritima]|uniref:Xanthine dehydrogenase n=3 Tax=Ardenticatena maritima TaxID=872965 RepID=A0A0P6Y8T3_9CHLR|nr:xanthine dehydrogenase family protein molybdopterin-binding subunit [Ardenticatena maritima]KPL86345.1 xanthine dehydrogenase [Ardenticatena maritima]